MLKLSGISNSFKRDIKRVKAQGKKYKLLETVLTMLLEGVPLPQKYYNHKLTGNPCNSCVLIIGYGPHYINLILLIIDFKFRKLFKYFNIIQLAEFIQIR